MIEGGSLIFNGDDIYKMDADRFREEIRWKHISMIFQGAMNALTRSMAVEYAPRKIRVNAISTGFIESGEQTDRTLAEQGQREWLEQAIPLPYFGVPDDIAWGAVYLAADESRYVTGTVLPIDGGFLACPS